jgi:hypothetical protein
MNISDGPALGCILQTKLNGCCLKEQVSSELKKEEFRT